MKETIMGTSALLIHPAEVPGSSIGLAPEHFKDSLMPPSVSPAGIAYDTGGAGSQLIKALENSYTIILASGPEDGGKRATIALSMACTALSMELPTLVFMIGEGSYWAYEGHADGIQTNGFPALTELFDSFIDLGGNLAVCSTCNHTICHAPSQLERALVRRNGVDILGMASVMDRLLQGRVVTF
jgi:predicted peroxiredoxin